MIDWCSLILMSSKIPQFAQLCMCWVEVKYHKEIIACRTHAPSRHPRPAPCASPSPCSTSRQSATCSSSAFVYIFIHVMIYLLPITYLFYRNERTKLQLNENRKQAILTTSHVLRNFGSKLVWLKPNLYLLHIS